MTTESIHKTSAHEFYDLIDHALFCILDGNDGLSDWFEDGSV